MSAFLRFLNGLLCAVLLLGWTSAAASGRISLCEGDGHEPCSVGQYHAWLPSETDCCEDHHDSPFLTEPGPAEYDSLIVSAAPSGCPADHRHTAISLEMKLPSGLAVMEPLWFEFSAVPQPPPTGRSANLTSCIAVIPEPVPPGPPPLHEACGPLLI